MMLPNGMAQVFDTNTSQASMIYGRKEGPTESWKIDHNIQRNILFTSLLVYCKKV